MAHSPITSVAKTSDPTSAMNSERHGPAAVGWEPSSLTRSREVNWSRSRRKHAASSSASCAAVGGVYHSAESAATGATTAQRVVVAWRWQFRSKGCACRAWARLPLSTTQVTAVALVLFIVPASRPTKSAKSASRNQLRETVFLATFG